MIVRDLKRVILLVGPLALLLLLSASLWHSGAGILSPLLGDDTDGTSSSAVVLRKPILTANKTHYEIFSATSHDGKYYELRFGRHVFNPNIVPHPNFNNTWFVVGQMFNEPGDFDQSVHEAVCLAQFIKGVLMCIDYVKYLPIEPTKGDKCDGDLAYINFNVGPHDARVFMGPQSPYIIYGSNGKFTCFSQWIQDFRKLTDWEYELMTNTDFPLGTEIERPAPHFALEKNYFVFWDNYDEMHVHYDMHPKRGYSKLERNGSVGPNLAPKTTSSDEKCLQRYMPEMPKELESIHQASNSLKVTMCKRADKKCEPHDGNTYIMTIIQHKSYYGYHSEYEPYVVLFQQRSPFELYAISKKPLWISGRQRHEGRKTDMMYVTSVNWRERGVRYHGYLDDVAFIGFGYEDRFSGAIDVRMSDLLVDMGICDDAP